MNCWKECMSTAIIAHGYVTPVIHRENMCSILWCWRYCFLLQYSWLLYFSEKECRECNLDFSKNCESIRHHSPCQQEVFGLKAELARDMPHRHNHWWFRLSAMSELNVRRSRRLHVIWCSILLLCVRYSERKPFFLKLAAVLWAFRQVASIMRRDVSWVLSEIRC